MKINKLATVQKLILLSLFNKWNPIALGCHTDRGTKDCPLCHRYGDRCEHCPIYKKTGKRFCQKTPYASFILTPEYKTQRYTFIEEEIEFLIFLLDEKVQENLESLFIEWSKYNKQATVTAWEVYDRDLQKSIIFKNEDLAKRQIVFDKSHEIDICTTIVWLTGEELSQFKNGEAVALSPDGHDWC